MTEKRREEKKERWKKIKKRRIEIEITEKRRKYRKD